MLSMLELSNRLKAINSAISCNIIPKQLMSSYQRNHKIMFSMIKGLLTLFRFSFFLTQSSWNWPSAKYFSHN